MEDLQTKFPFKLRRGYVDPDGRRHAEGVMRLATAADELKPILDPRVRQNEAYAAVIILSRVIVRLGDIEDVNPMVIENLFAADFAYLNEFYDRINAPEPEVTLVTCPSCDTEFELEAPPPPGES